MLNGKKIAWDEAMARRIVDLRESGYTWKQIDALLFPGLQHKDRKSGSYAGDFCVKHRRAHPIVEGAFTKQVFGMFTPTQIVVKVRKFDPFAVKKEEQTRVTMADLGL